MNPRAHALRVGAKRGWTEFKLSLRAPDDILFYLMWSVGLLVFLFLARHDTVEGTELSSSLVALPGVLAAMVVFGAVVGPAYALVTEREDGTLLRAKAAPHGLDGYVTGQVVYQGLGVLPMFVLILVPPIFFLDGLVSRGVVGWVAVVGVVALGTLAVFPIGFVVGSIARKPAHVTTWAILPVMGLAAISGIFTPITALWGWVQGVSQAFPMYWLGHALRWAFLPDAAAVFEVGGRWNLPVAFGIVVAWGLVGLAVTPRILGRMARRESGSAVEARKAERMQRIG
ncbi:MAG: ABC transporter permease [Actinomycetales bacterium]|nr:ABC transporter permease [Actinomycetales bacterium]